jgi:hypothetical protein
MTLVVLGRKPTLEPWLPLEAGKTIDVGDVTGMLGRTEIEPAITQARRAAWAQLDQPHNRFHSIVSYPRQLNH